MNFKLETIYVISKLIDIIEYCEFDLVTYLHFNQCIGFKLQFEYTLYAEEL